MKRLTIILGILLLSSSLLNAQSEPPDGLSELAAYSLFYSNYKNGDYPFALKYGRWMIDGEVKSIEGNPRYKLSTQYERMIKIYTEIAKSKQDPSQKAAYADSALALFDEALKKFSDEEIDKFEWELDKGRFLQSNANLIEDGLAKAYAQYEKVFDMATEELTKLSDGYYVQIMLSNKVAKGEKDEALAMINKAEPYASEKLKEFFDNTRNDLFDSPEERITFLEGKLAEDPKNLELMEELAGLYEDVDNRQKMVEMKRKIYEVSPTYESAKDLGDISRENANNSQAVKFYKEALEKAETAEQKETISLALAGVYTSMEQLRQARRYAREALQHNPNSGRAYIQIANIYGQAVSQCTSDRKLEVEDRVVYWLVLDYLDRARRVDQSLANRVSQLYQTYEPVTPTQENKFFKGWKEGTKMKVDESLVPCYDWVNETTSVR